MTVKKIPFKKSFEYSFKDEQLRKIIYDTVIPYLKHHREGAKIIFDYPGYYEFALEWNEEKQQIEPMFFDYNPDIKKTHLIE